MSSSPKKKGGFKPFLSKAEQEELARKARLRRKAKAKAAAAQLEQDRREALEEAERERAEKEWNDCLAFLESSVPIYEENPWLFINDCRFTYRFLFCLSHVLAEFRNHAADVTRIREVLSPVYEVFVTLANFAMCHPAFYLSDPYVLGLLVKLCGQVAHKSNAKSLHPNLLRILLPTIKRTHLHDLFLDLPIAGPLLKWVDQWVPGDSTLSVILQCIHLFSLTEGTRLQLAEHPNLQLLQVMSMGLVPGLAQKHHVAVQLALKAFPPPVVETEEEPEEPEE